MASLFADENFPLPVVRRLRLRGHDVLTAVEAGLANRRIPDDIVLEYATRLGRAVITFNWDDFLLLHDGGVDHAGIIACEVETDHDVLAARVDAAAHSHTSLVARFVEVRR